MQSANFRQGRSKMSDSSLPFVVAVIQNTPKATAIKVMSQDIPGAALIRSDIFNDKGKARPPSDIALSLDQAIERDLPKRHGAVNYTLLAVDNDEKDYGTETVSRLGLAGPKETPADVGATMASMIEAAMKGIMGLMGGANKIVEGASNQQAAIRSHMDSLEGKYNNLYRVQEKLVDKLADALVTSRDQTGSAIDALLVAKMTPLADGSPSEPRRSTPEEQQAKLMAIGGMVAPILETANRGIDAYIKSKTVNGHDSRPDIGPMSPAVSNLCAILRTLTQRDIVSAFLAWQDADPDLRVLHSVVCALPEPVRLPIRDALLAIGSETAGDKPSERAVAS